MKPKRQIWVGAISGICSIFFATFSLSSCANVPDMNPFFEESSPNGDHAITTYYVENNSVLAVRDSGELVVFANGEELFTERIHNDGATLNSDNYNIIWEADKAILTLSGSEQTDKRYEIVFSDNGVTYHELTDRT